MKKAAAFCLTILLALCLMAGNALAYTDFTDYTGNTAYSGNVGPSVVMLFDQDSGTILYQKNIDEQIRPASTTKIMTCLLALESGKLDETVTISAKASGQGGSSLDIFKGEEIILRDLINGMMMKSGNDAAVAVAEFLGTDIEGFAAMMNAKAGDLGMTGTNFVVPHGMDTDNHYSTARDMAKLTAYAMKNPEFAQIVNQKSYTMPADNHYRSEWIAENTNHLMDPEDPDYYQYATGVKTGSTPAGGDCLVASATKDGMNLVCMIFKDEYNGSARWPLAKNLFEWGFENFKTVDAASLLGEENLTIQETVENASVADSGGGVLEISVAEADGVYVTLDKAVAEGLLGDNPTDTIEIEKTYTVDYPLQAPILKDDLLGTVTFKTSAGALIYSGSMIASRDVTEAGTEPNVSGETPVEIQTPVPVNPKDIGGDAGNLYIYILLGIAALLIAFLVFRMITANRRKHKRFKHRQPHYSYKIRKR